MLELDQYKTTLGTLKEPLEEVKASLDLKGKQNRAVELEKMMEEKGLPCVVLNQSISGNRLLSDTAKEIPGQLFGFSAKRRYNIDINSLCGLTHIIFAIGGNDLYQPGTMAAPNDSVPSAQELFETLQMLNAKAKEKGLKTYAATITPFSGAEGTPSGRQELERIPYDWKRQ